MVTFRAGADRVNVNLLVFAAGHRTDRMNVPDTLEAQYSAGGKPPMVLLSDRSVGLASISGSSVPGHTALCGDGLSGYGEGSYATERNGRRRSARTKLFTERRVAGFAAEREWWAT